MFSLLPRILASAALIGIAIVAIPGPGGAVPGAGPGSPATASRMSRPAPTPPNVTTIATGGFDSLVIGADGRAYGTGSNYLGRLTGTATRKRALILLTGLPRGVKAIAVAGGYANTLVVGDDGVPYGTGLNMDGQITGTRDFWHTLHPMSGLPQGVRAVSVAAGAYHTLVLGGDGVAYGAGDNGGGQLTGSPAEQQRTLAPLTGLPAGVSAIAVAAGSFFSLVLGDDGVAYGTGRNRFGELTGTDTPLRTLTPLTGLPAGVTATAISATRQQSVLLGSDGVAYGTGHNQSAQLTGLDNPRRTLGPLTGLPAGVRALAVSAGAAHTLVLGDDGRAYGTGSNQYGQLTHEFLPFRVSLTALTRPSHISPPIGIAAGGRHSLVLGEDGRASGTGAGNVGQLGGRESFTHLVWLTWGLANVVRPTIEGIPRLGGRLTVRPGEWWPRPASYQYRWFRDGSFVRGATTKSWVVTEADQGARLKVRVIAEAPDYRRAARFSPPVGPIRR